MSLLANRRVRIIKDKVTLVKRTMDGKGKLTVQVGQEVSPMDSLGRFTKKAGIHKIDLAQELGISPKEVKQTLQRKIGQSIFKGELLAFKTAVFGKDKMFTSPSDGTLESFDENTGVLSLELNFKEYILPAAVFGIVEKVDPLRGEVTIKTQASEIYGIAGVGKIREGKISILGKPDNLVDERLLSPILAETILVAGALTFGSGIAKAISCNIRGIITGGIHAKDYLSMAGGSILKRSLGTDIGVSVLVTEGFGALPLGEDIFNLLSQFNNQFAIIDGNRSKLVLPSFDKTSMITVRKTALPKVDLTEGLPEVEINELELGQQVRVIGTKFLGQQGKVIAIDSSVSELASKVSTFLVTIETRHQKLKVPYTNLEII